MTGLQLIVTQTRAETPNVRRILLGAADGSVLSGFTPGSTITLDIPAIGQRKYSLIDDGASQENFDHPRHYMVGVRLAEDSQGGSRFMHRLAVGDRINASPPDNDFALDGTDRPVLLIAGGIGVTPLISKAASMKATGRPFRFVYAARNAAEFAFLNEIKNLAGDTLLLHNDADSGAVLDLPSLLQTVGPDEVVHICGPRPMLQVAMHEARERHWPEGKLRFELFYSLKTPVTNPEPILPKAEGGGSFEIEIKSTGAVFLVPPDKSIVDVLNEAGLDPLYDCNKGECGVCQVGVLAGEPDHRDFILSESERAANNLIQICVSRAKSARLVLDL